MKKNLYSENVMQLYIKDCPGIIINAPTIGEFLRKTFFKKFFIETNKYS